MKPSDVLAQSPKRIRALALERGVSNSSFFGSVLRGEGSKLSDLDILVNPALNTYLLNITKLQIRLETELGIEADVHTVNTATILSPLYCRARPTGMTNLQKISLIDYLTQIIHAIEKIALYLADVTGTQILAARLLENSAVRNVATIGVAANKVDKKFPAFAEIHK